MVVAKRLDRELLDEVRSRSGTSGQVVLLDGKDVVVSTLGASTTRALVSNTDGRTGRERIPGKHGVDVATSTAARGVRIRSCIRRNQTSMIST